LTAVHQCLSSVSTATLTSDYGYGNSVRPSVYHAIETP